MRSRSRFVSCAWAALLAMVFSALSPALAAAALRDRPAALGQMLGIPGTAQAALAHDDGCDHGVHAPAHDAHHDGVAHESTPPTAPDDGSAHRAHGIYCSFCLNASATAAVLVAPALFAIAASGSAAVVTEPAGRASAASYPFFRSRAPPSVLQALS
jgi:hypothetical protein